MWRPSANVHWGQEEKDSMRDLEQNLVIHTSSSGLSSNCPGARIWPQPGGHWMAFLRAPPCPPSSCRKFIHYFIPPFFPPSLYPSIHLINVQQAPNTPGTILGAGDGTPVKYGGTVNVFILHVPHVAQQSKSLSILKHKNDRIRKEELACIDATCLQNSLEWDLTKVWLAMRTLALCNTNLSLVSPGLTSRAPGRAPGKSWVERCLHPPPVPGSSWDCLLQSFPC